MNVCKVASRIRLHVVADKRFICNHLQPICNHTTHRGTARYAERLQMADKNGKNIFLGR